MNKSLKDIVLACSLVAAVAGGMALAVPASATSADATAVARSRRPRRPRTRGPFTTLRGWAACRTSPACSRPTPASAMRAPCRGPPRCTTPP